MNLKTTPNFVQVEALHVYPIKSCGGISLPEAVCDERGIENDRRWMVVDPDGMQVTQREFPQLARVLPQLRPDSLELHFPGRDSFSLEITRPLFEKMSVEVWGHRCLALDEGEAAAAWFSNVLSQPVRLVRFAAEDKRMIDVFWAGDTGAHTAFADALPLLILSKESLEYLNQERIKRGMVECEMSRFRPNIVISGCGPFGEDLLPALSLPNSNYQLELVRPCARCPIVNIDQRTAERERIGNLQILGETRLFKNQKGKAGAMFGVYAILTSNNATASNANSQAARIRCGDKLQIVENSAGLPPLPRLHQAE